MPLLVGVMGELLLLGSGWHCKGCKSVGCPPPLRWDRFLLGSSGPGWCQHPDATGFAWQAAVVAVAPSCPKRGPGAVTGCVWGWVPFAGSRRCPPCCSLLSSSASLSLSCPAKVGISPCAPVLLVGVGRGWAGRRWGWKLGRCCGRGSSLRTPLADTEYIQSCMHKLSEGLKQGSSRHNWAR